MYYLERETFVWDFELETEWQYATQILDLLAIVILFKCDLNFS